MGISLSWYHNELRLIENWLFIIQPIHKFKKKICDTHTRIYINFLKTIIPWEHILPLEILVLCPVTDFSVSICSTPKFIYCSDNVAPKLLITENDISYESYIIKNRMVWTSYQFKIEFITNTYLKEKGK